MTVDDRCTATYPHPAHRTQYGPFGVKDCPGVPVTPANAPTPTSRAQDEPESDARRLLDQAIDTALPLAGGLVRKRLKALRRELVRVDAKRAEQASEPRPAAHPWQEYNPHGNTCHHPGCRLTEEEHADPPAG